MLLKLFVPALVLLLTALPAEAQAAGGCCDGLFTDPTLCSPGQNTQQMCQNNGGTWHPGWSCPAAGQPCVHAKPALPGWAAVMLAGLLFAAGVFVSRNRSRDLAT